MKEGLKIEGNMDFKNCCLIPCVSKIVRNATHHVGNPTFNGDIDYRGFFLNLRVAEGSRRVPRILGIYVWFLSFFRCPFGPLLQQIR